MSTPHICLGRGHLSARVCREIKRRLDLEVTQYTDAQCNCGYGCRPYTCPRSARHWIDAEGWEGAPSNQLAELAREAQQIIEQYATKADRKWLEAAK